MKSKSIVLSGIIIAKNEEARIQKCISAMSFCDEIILIDNGSIDGTTNIARKNHATVYSTDTTDFSQLRNFAIPKTLGRWLLYVDADELVSPELSVSILNVIGENKQMVFGSYLLKRMNYYLGKPWPQVEQMLRLFRRDALLGWSGTLHETANTRGEVAVLDGFLLHDTHRTLEEMVEKTNIWSDLEADLRMKANHPQVSWWRLLRVMWTGFYRSYLSQSGWKAGIVGFIESTYQGFSMFITYAKLYERQLDRK
jgi:glycosyltransferase involved in cell wall biosynthesis